MKVNMDKKIGQAIKYLRKVKKMTLQELSEQADLSISYLSMLERGLNSPTIANLQKICNVFGIMLPELLTHLEKGNPLVKKADRRVIFQDEKGVRYEAITEGPHHLTGLVMIVTDNNIHMSDVHAIDELGYVVSGSLDMTVDSITYHLCEGDSLYIPAFTKHNFGKTSEEDCLSIWFYQSSASETRSKGEVMDKSKMQITQL